MRNIDWVSEFVQIDDALKNIPDHDLFDRERYRSDFSLSVSEAVTLLLFYRTEGFRHLKAFQRHVSLYLKHLFPGMPSYARFMRRLRDAETALELLLAASLSKWDGFGSIDSTKIETSTKDRKGKVFGRIASFGYTAFGRFFGVKLHILVNKSGGVVRWRLTTGSVHDLTPVKEGFLDGLTGMTLADSGYVSREMRFALMAANLDFVAKPRKTMDEIDREEWVKRYVRVYKCRQRVESVFNVLKNSLSLVSTRHHHPAMLRIAVLSTLLAYQLSL